MAANIIATQNDLLLKNLLYFYKMDNNLKKMLDIINGESRISLRIVDWFATNYAKQQFSVYTIIRNGVSERFNVYRDYKLKLKAYSKKRFDPFCRWDRINVPYNNEQDKYIQTTIGQLNFFKWALENKVVKYIEDHYDDIEHDMNSRNSTAKNNSVDKDAPKKTRKKREELSISAVKTVKKETVEIIVKFD
jgi:hypothetical protein